MFLLQGVILLLVLPYGWAQIHLRQAQLSITRAETKTARIVCEASGIQNFRGAVIHWYRHRPGEAPQRILYISSSQPAFDKISDKNKFNCEKKPDQPISTLVVNEIAPNDGATYYCAYWDLTVLESHRQPKYIYCEVVKAPTRIPDSKPEKTSTMTTAPVTPLVGGGDGAAQVQLTQDQLSITKKLKKTVRIDCKVSGINFGDAYIHWYRQRPGEAPEWILYFKTQTDKSNFDMDKFSVDKTTEKSTCTLTVDKLTYNDTATYYCAYWDRTVLESHRQAVEKPHSILSHSL
ncbi:uncharacterized protein ACDP82_001206 [Pangshura tecta]